MDIIIDNNIIRKENIKKMENLHFMLARKYFLN